MANYDWIWSMHAPIETEFIIQMWELLIRDIKEFLGNHIRVLRDRAGDYEPTLEELCYVPSEIKQKLNLLKNNITIHVAPPMAMTTGHKGLADKVQAETYKAHLTSPSNVSLDNEFDMVFGYCADMGTELRMPTFEVNGSVETTLPSWVERGAVADDVVADDRSDDDLGDDIVRDDDDSAIAPEPAAAPPVRPAAIGMRQFMPNAYIVTGIQHTTNNLNDDTHSIMPGFAEHFKDLKQCEALPSNDDRRRHYVATCVRGTRYEKFERLFRSFSAHLYEGRWHEIVRFVRDLVKLVWLLAATFDVITFQSAEVGGGYQEGSAQAKTKARKGVQRGRTPLDPQKIARCLVNGVFHFYN